MKHTLTAAVALAIAGSLPGSVTAAADNLETLRKEIDALKSQNDTLARRLDATAAMMENTPAGDSRTKIGGYGEMHYNNLSNDGPKGDKKELDFHRFVLFFSHAFTDRIRFHSEVELEHVIASHSSGDPGEIELEQAYVEFDLSPRTSVKGGLFLVPVGILNETHEPPTFYGVERNPVEKNIIPTTWWEGGAMVSGRFAKAFSYDVALTSGLNTSASSNYAVRSGRQKVAEAKANDLAYTARLKWTGMPGVELAGTVQYQQDITQSSDPTAGSATLLETHAIINRGPFGLRALYAAWNLDGNGPAAVGADKQNGWYVEPAFRVSPKLGMFARYSVWDNQAGNSTDTEYKQTNVGLNYWPHPDVVLKADYQTQDAPTGKDAYKGINLGIGYQF